MSASTGRAQPAALVLHGFTAAPGNVDALIRHLRAAGYATSAPTLRGHGTRPEDLERVRWQDWLEDAAAALHDLRARHDDVSVAGHSMGALVAAVLAAREPGVNALALIAPALEYANPAVKLLPVLGRFVKYWNSGRLSVADPDLAREHAGINYPRFPVSAFRELFALSRVAPDELRRVRCPTLIVHPRRDTVIPARAALTAHERAACDTKRLHWLERSDHEVFLDAERDAAAAVITAFFDDARRAAHAAHPAGLAGERLTP